MEPTVCPWCYTEIVWDEEIGPEEHCPHCMNELGGYRTLSIQIDDEEEDNKPAADHLYEASKKSKQISAPARPRLELEEEDDLTPILGDHDLHELPALRVLDQYEESHDLLAYEEGVEKVLDSQDLVLECPQCREYMMLTGTQQVAADQFNPVSVPGGNSPILKPPFAVQVYICSGCFHVQHTLSEADRLRLIEGLSQTRK
ncbi:hypothetical protein Q5741_13385 [Paenibacillus sp. JX-17]|uniref:Uncharacterized protein n=1 Tax=Paenibacillus lacisoli TaxID=3064525 RepID=A0ABT9CDP8_9BACL|nr:hypothetical protein [Paenibacillus sp. JX-17]MDO7907400.1 hypothetical protein [Paenibacillus sp. JX-17]